MIRTTDKVHLHFFFNLSAPHGFKLEKKTILFCTKQNKKTRLDKIRFSLGDSNHKPVDFNSETLLFTIQPVEI